MKGCEAHSSGSNTNQRTQRSFASTKLGRWNHPVCNDWGSDLLSAPGPCPFPATSLHRPARRRAGAVGGVRPAQGGLDVNPLQQVRVLRRRPSAPGGHGGAAVVILSIEVAVRRRRCAGPHRTFRLGDRPGPAVPHRVPCGDLVKIVDGAHGKGVHCWGALQVSGAYGRGDASGLGHTWRPECVHPWRTAGRPGSQTAAACSDLWIPPTKACHASSTYGPVIAAIAFVLRPPGPRPMQLSFTHTGEP